MCLSNVASMHFKGWVCIRVLAGNSSQQMFQIKTESRDHLDSHGQARPRAANKAWSGEEEPGGSWS